MCWLERDLTVSVILNPNLFPESVANGDACCAHHISMLLPFLHYSYGEKKAKGSRAKLKILARG